MQILVWLTISAGLIPAVAIPQRATFIAQNVTTASGPGNFTLSHVSPTSLGCSGSTTCSVTLTGSIANGDYVAISCIFSNDVAVLSTNVGGTVKPVFSSMGGSNDTGLYTSSAFIPAATATAGPVVITASGNIGTGSTCKIWDYTVSSGTPKLDHSQAIYNASPTSPYNGITPVYSGTNDVNDAETDSVFSSPTAVANYTNGSFGTNIGFAHKINSTSTTPPSWTAASVSHESSNDLAVATNAVACDDVDMLDFTSVTAGTTLTAANVGSSNFGLTQTGGDPNGLFGWATNTTPIPQMTAQTDTPPSLVGAVIPCDRSSHSASQTRVAQMAISASTASNYVGKAIPGNIQVATLSGYHECNPTSTNDIDVDGMGQAAAGIVTEQCGKSGANIVALLECAGGTTNFSSTITLPSATTYYWFTTQMNVATGAQLSIYTDSSLSTQIGSTVNCLASGWTATAINTWVVGQFGSSGASITSTIKYADTIFDPHGTFPYGH